MPNKDKEIYIKTSAELLNSSDFENGFYESIIKANNKKIKELSSELKVLDGKVIARLTILVAGLFLILLNKLVPIITISHSDIILLVDLMASAFIIKGFYSVVKRVIVFIRKHIVEEKTICSIEEELNKLTDENKVIKEYLKEKETIDKTEDKSNFNDNFEQKYSERDIELISKMLDEFLNESIDYCDVDLSCETQIDDFKKLTKTK